ncbi:Glycosyltransferase [Ruminiclostridium cellobioparum subsp. termitidis CT1112]|uniref:Glycosyltransferase n=2 Tax=Ruminiclostridium cellobioparum TaxID=29355 RepID=S0FGQ4_RUMCE|nr:Glycosyltransferase [Ruminiclostridium cellobioparum subsp. termitidis CT1112]
MLASVASMIDQFNMSNIDILKSKGYEVHVAANFEYGNTSSKERVKEFKKELEALGIKYYHIDFSRDIKDVIGSIKAYKKIVQLVIKNKYEFIHCHSPIGGVCGRVAAFETKTKVIYTAHGFHFFKGAPLLNWLIYYPVERWLAKYTDVLITINREDYERTKTFKAKRIEYIPGVGINIVKIGNVNIDTNIKRNELGISSNSLVILSVGELNKNKNHETVLKAISILKERDICYLICGTGSLEEYLKKLCTSLGIEDKVKFLGFRNDIYEIYKLADIFVFPSFREGLSVALMESMASGLPVVCSKIRGNTDLVKNNRGGFCVGPHDVNGFTESIKKLFNNDRRIMMGNFNKEAIKNNDVICVQNKMNKIYSDIN